MAESVERPAPFRRRPDLVDRRLTLGTKTFWVVKEPLGLRYYRLQEEEYALLSWLDGRRSLQEICREFDKRFAPQRLRPEDLAQFLMQLHEQGLIVGDSPDQGAALWQRRGKQRRKDWWRRLTNPLAIRFRGIDPQRFLDATYPRIRFLYSPAALAVAGLTIVSALVLIAVQWDKFCERLPTHEQFFTPATLLGLSAVLTAVKILHELGHAYTCRRYGGACHELGLMFLVFSPCLYCNVTDAWQFPRRRRRIAVYAAGMLVELTLAAMATFGWWFSTVGLWHHLCLNVMFVCSVNTLLFNGNPLLRYDGYFILAELVAVPNLAEKSAGVFRSWLRRLVSPPPAIPDPLLPERRRIGYGAYHLASTIYRWTLTFSILLFLMSLAKPYHLEAAVRTAACVSVGLMLGRPAWRLAQFLRAADLIERIKPVRASLSVACGAAALTVLFFAPLPKRVWGTVEVALRQGQRVYVDVPGLLVEQPVVPGERVTAGAVVARLVNDDLELEIAELRAKCEQYRARLSSLEQERYFEPAAALRLPEYQKLLSATETGLEKKLRDRDRLTLTARRDGTVFPPAISAPKSARRGDLPAWFGRPHERRNLGCLLDEGTLYCEVGDPGAWESVIVVEQSDLSSLALGQAADVVLDELPDVVFSGIVTEIAAHEMAAAPPQLANKAGGEIPTTTDSDGAEVPIVKSYQVRVSVDDPEGLLRLGLKGTAKIRVPWEPVGRRILRWCARTFHFRL